jgi:hypothetical protein
MNEILVVVKEVTVKVLTGDPSEDPHGQGFSVIFAEALVEDDAAVDRLAVAKENGSPVTLRCAMLDVRGSVTKGEREGRSHRFVVAVEELTYRKPTHAWEHPEPSRRRPA